MMIMIQLGSIAASMKNKAMKTNATKKLRHSEVLGRGRGDVSDAEREEWYIDT